MQMAAYLSPPLVKTERADTCAAYLCAVSPHFEWQMA